MCFFNYEVPIDVYELVFFQRISRALHLKVYHVFTFMSTSSSRLIACYNALKPVFSPIVLKHRAIFSRLQETHRDKNRFTMKKSIQLF